MNAKCYATDNSWKVLSDFHDTNPDVNQYMTECWTSSQSTGWSAASDFTMGPLQNWAQGAMAWTLATNTEDGPHLSGGGCDTCRGLVVVDTSAGTYEFQVDYYMMAQYSKFIPQGATVLNGSGSYTYDGGSGIQSVASLNPDGTRTVVIENTFGNDIYLMLDTTSGEEWSGNIYPNSVVTWILP
jgi:glucan endo-1,6-beta-glucosidase